MNKKISIGITIALVIITAAASFAITMGYSQRIYNKLIPNLSARLERRYELDEIEEQVNQDYYFADSINNKQLNAAIAKGYLAGLGDDNNNRYFSPDEYLDYTEKLEGKARGIGVTYTIKPDTGFIYVSNVAPGSPAEQEGLIKGDEIINIEGTGINQKNYESKALELQGMSFTSVTLTYRRAGADKTINVMRGYDAQSVTYEVDGNIGYVRISKFYKNTAAQLEKAIAELTAKNVTAVVFDVRNTKDGSIEYTAKAVDVIVPIATEGIKAIAIAFDNKGNPRQTFSSNAGELNLPSAVLINGETSGCGEFFAVSLVDFKRSLLVGEKTKGGTHNDTMQEIFRMNDGGALLLTVAIVKPYLTDSYAGSLMPNREVSLTEEQNANFDLMQRMDDTQYQLARSILAKDEG